MRAWVHVPVCVSVLRMTEGFWQNEVTLFYQVNLCGGGQEKMFVCLRVCLCVCAHLRVCMQMCACCMYGLLVMSDIALTNCAFVIVILHLL